MASAKGTTGRRKSAKSKGVTLDASGRRLLPTWVRGHFETALDAHDKLLQITRLSAQGISMHTGRPRLLEALAKADGEEKAHVRLAGLDDAKKDAALAQREIDEDFPVLHGLVTIALWSWLEHFVKGLLEVWFLHRPAAMNTPAIHRLKVRLGDYMQLSKAEQAGHLVELLEQELAGPLKQGLGRFNCLLEVIGFNVVVSDEAKRTIFEHQRVRNVLAHRNGRVDARFKSECPWMKYKVGAELRVSRTMLLAYTSASAEFLLALLYLVGDDFKINLRPKDDLNGPPVAS
jgi:hypothetical protein